MRIFLDANILFSAAKTEGAVRELLSLIRARGHTCCADDYVVEEARRNLAAKAPERQEELERILGSVEVHPFPPEAAGDAMDLPISGKDRAVVAAAIHLRCEALVTGDRTHFGPLYGKSVRGVRILSPRSLAEKLLT